MNVALDTFFFSQGFVSCLRYRIITFLYVSLLNCTIQHKIKLALNAV